jgi:type II secretory pathway pseudopilin PulG
VTNSIFTEVADCSRRRSSAGFTYIALLAAIVIIGIVMSQAGKYWQNVMQRDKEEELLFRGNQYRTAIERYYNSPPPGQFPNSIDDLLTDNRTAKGKRHLRRKYKDPVTGEDFELVRDLAKGNRIVGVFSKSDATPLRQTGFAEENKDFEGKEQYSDWKFVFTPLQDQQLPLKPLPRPSVPPTNPPPTGKPAG